MRSAVRNILDWAPVVVAIGTVVGATAYAFSRKSAVAQGIREVGSLASTLSETAEVVEQAVWTVAEIEELASRERSLTSRRADSLKPALVVAQLSEAARRNGLTVLEIGPASRRRSSSSRKLGVERAEYRVSVRGEYQAIAEYMQACVTERIPVRVVGADIVQYQRDDGSYGEGLRADVIVEAFQPRDEAETRDDA